MLLFWSFKTRGCNLPAPSRKNSVTSTRIGGFADYVELLVRNASNDGCRTGLLRGFARYKNDRVDATTHAPGVTVGVGHDPTTPEQAPGKGTR